VNWEVFSPVSPSGRDCTELVFTVLEMFGRILHEIIHRRFSEMVFLIKKIIVITSCRAQ
jgi:hypothetical protein